MVIKRQEMKQQRMKDGDSDRKIEEKDNSRKIEAVTAIKKGRYYEAK